MSFENRLVEVEKNQTTIGEYTYDGDGSRVKSVAGGDREQEPFLFANRGLPRSLRFARNDKCCVMRVGTTLSYLFEDHLGSTSITADASGNVSGELR